MRCEFLGSLAEPGFEVIDGVAHIKSLVSSSGALVLIGGVETI